MNLRRRGLLLLGAGLLACGDSTAPRTVTGNWSGNSIASGSLFQITLQLVDAGGTITGSGSVLSAGIDCLPSVTGSRSGSTVDLALSCTGYTPFTFNASLSKDGRNLAGTLNGSGFDDASLNLSKQ